MSDKVQVNKSYLNEVIGLLEQFRDVAMSGYHATDTALIADSERVDQIIKDARK